MKNDKLIALLITTTILNTAQLVFNQNLNWYEYLLAGVAVFWLTYYGRMEDEASDARRNH